MRRLLCVAALWVVLFVVVVPVFAQAPGCLWPDFEVDKVGHFKFDKYSNLTMQIVDVIDNRTMLVRIPKGKHPPFIVKDYPTKSKSGLAGAGLVRGKWIELKGQWKCTGTKKIEGKTHHVVEPVKDKGK